MRKVAAVRFRSRTPDGVLADHASLAAAMGLPAQGPWLFVSPHDDDVHIGAGLAVLAAIEAGIEVHVVVSSDGRFGFVDPADRLSISATRAAECRRAFDLLGVPAHRLTKLDYPDGDLADWQGIRDLPGGARGLSYDYTGVLRRVRPTVVFGPTPTDLHGDHRATSEDLDIACFHASGGIWSHLGDPVDVPVRYDYAVYCDFAGPPDIQIRAQDEEFERVLGALEAFASQPLIIAAIVEGLVASGPVGYLRRHDWALYRPDRYDVLFEPPGR